MNVLRAISSAAVFIFIVLYSFAAVMGGNIAFSPDGATIAYSVRNQITLYNLIENKIISKLESKDGKYIRTIKFSSNGSMIVSAGDGEFIRFWEVPSGRELKSFRVLDARVQKFGPDSTVNTVTFSPDDQIVASGGHGRNGIIKLCDVRTGKEIGQMRGHQSAVYHVTFSPDGKLLASCSFDETARLWEVRNRREIRRFEGHGSPVYSVCFSPDGKTLASAGGDMFIHIWDLGTGKELRKFEADNWIYNISYAPDGKLIASSGQSKTTDLWNVKTGMLIRRFRGRNDRTGASIAFSPDGRVLASLDNIGLDIDIKYFKLSLEDLRGGK